jgi:hypothetical protein
MGFHRPVLAKTRCRERGQGRHETLLDLPASALSLMLLAGDVAQHARLRVGQQADHGHKDKQRAVVES